MRAHRFSMKMQLSFSHFIISSLLSSLLFTLNAFGLDGPLTKKREDTTQKTEALTQQQNTNLSATNVKHILTQDFLGTKQKIALSEGKKRVVMGDIYHINEKIKKMSGQTAKITNKVLAATGNAKRIAQDINSLEDSIKSRRKNLSLRLKAIYKMGLHSEMRILFSATGPNELEKNLNYLKRISERDYLLIKALQEDLALLKAQRKKLKKEISILYTLKGQLKSQEHLLESEQEKKFHLLGSLRDQEQVNRKKLKGLRQKSQELGFSDQLSQAFAMSFFERKGQLQKPAEGRLLQGFGLIQNSDFKYILSHKGHFYSAGVGSPVHAIHRGQVSFAGEVPGYGKTLIIDHEDHYYSVYSYLKNIKVHAHQTVKTGDIIGNTGMAGPQFGAGLYFEIRHFSEPIDPMPWFKKETQLVKNQPQETL